MKEQMKKILHQQQEYEYIKKLPSLRHPPNNLLVSSLITATVLPYIRKASHRRRRQKRQNQIAKLIFYLFLIYYILALLFSFL